MRQGLSETAQRVLDELDLMDAITDPVDAIAKANVHSVGASTAINLSAKASRLVMAAACLIRAAEILTDRLPAEPLQPAAEPIGEDQQD